MFVRTLPRLDILKSFSSLGGNVKKTSQQQNNILYAACIANFALIMGCGAKQYEITLTEDAKRHTRRSHSSKQISSGVFDCYYASLQERELECANLQVWAEKRKALEKEVAKATEKSSKSASSSSQRSAASVASASSTTVTMKSTTESSNSENAESSSTSPDNLDADMLKDFHQCEKLHVRMEKCKDELYARLPKDKPLPAMRPTPAPFGNGPMIPAVDNANLAAKDPGYRYPQVGFQRGHV